MMATATHSVPNFSINFFTFTVAASRIAYTGTDQRSKQQHTDYSSKSLVTQLVFLLENNLVYWISLVDVAV